MNELLKFEFGGFCGNPFLIFGIGKEGFQAVKYLWKAGISETDFGVTSQISTIKFDKYRSVICIMEYGDQNCLGFAKSLAERTKKTIAMMVGILILPLSKEQTLKMYYSNPEIETLKNEFNFLLLIPHYETLNMVNNLKVSTESEKSYQWLWFAYRTVFDMLNQQSYLWDFSCINSVIKNGRIGFFATGEAAKKPKLVNAVKNALYFNPEIIDYLGEAKDIIMQIISGAEVTTTELEVMFNYLNKIVDDNTEIHWRITLNTETGENVRISIVGTRLDKPPKEKIRFNFLGPK